MELKEIQELIDFVAKADVREVSLEKDDFKITIRTLHDQPAPPESTVPPYFMYPAMMPQGYSAAGPMSGGAPTPQQAPTATGSEEPGGGEAASSSATPIVAPMIGTFYRRPTPDQDVYVKVGDTVKKGDVVCIIEAMKLFNEIESEVEGKITKVLVDDAQPVEYDQPLFLVESA